MFGVLKRLTEVYEHFLLVYGMSYSKDSKVRIKIGFLKFQDM